MTAIIPFRLPLKPQIVTTRNSLFNSIRQGTASGRTDVRIENRQKYYVGNQAVSQLRVGQVGYYVKNDSTGEQSIGNDFTWETALEITSPALASELFTYGTNLPVILATKKNPLSISDTAMGIDIAAGGNLFVRQAVSVATNTLFIPTSSQAAPASDTGWISPSTNSQVNTTGAMVDPGSGSSFGGPQTILLGVPAAPMAAVCILGDSIADGTGDSVDTFGNLGFIARGLNSVNGYPVPWLRQTVGGDKLSQNTLDTAHRKRSLWPYVTHLICQLGTNDVAAASLSAMQTNVQAIWQAAKRTIGPYGKPLQVAQCLLMPKTTSTDSWATAANQTPATGFTVGGIRDQFNTWVKSQVGGGLLDAYIDANQYIEDQANPGKFITNGSANYPTTDGTHLTSALHILAAQAVNAWALTVSP